MIDQFVLFISITTRFAKSRSKRLRLSFFISREKEKPKRLVLIKLEHASIEKHDKLVKYQEKVLRIENLIKYLHFHVRVYIENINDNFFLNIEAFLKKSIKLIFNANILKMFCEISIDETKNKKWKKKSLYKIRAKNACYLILLNKKSRKSRDRSDYHLTDVFESRIAATKVWFIHDFTTATQRDKKMRKVTRKYRKWKIKILIIYIKQCKLYILKRRDWEFHIMLKTWKKSSIFWFITINNFDHFLNLANTNYQKEEINFIILIKSKNISRINIITYFDESEQEIFTKSKNNNEKNSEHNNEKDFANNYKRNSENNDEKIESKNNNEKTHIMSSALFSKSLNVITKLIVNDIES